MQILKYTEIKVVEYIIDVIFMYARKDRERNHGCYKSSHLMS